jgi:hypothetical protein
MESYSKLLVKTENVTLSDGQGFYSTLKLNTTFTIEPCEGMLNLEIATEEAEHYMTYVEQISITPHGAIQLRARRIILQSLFPILAALAYLLKTALATAKKAKSR